MTSLLDRPTTPVDSIPAWGVSVDLTPREVVTGRRARVTQRLVALGVVVVLLALAGLGTLSWNDRREAQREYDDAQSRTAALNAGTHRYDDISTMIQVRDQAGAAAATLMAGDVNVVQLMSRIRQALPLGVTINNLSVQITPPSDTATSPGTSTGTDTGTGTGTTIGTISVSGNGPRIKALAPFVAELNHLAGIVDVVPTSTTASDDGIDYTLTMSFTDLLYTHRFDQSTTTAGGTP